MKLLESQLTNMSVMLLETVPSNTGDLLQPGHIVKETWQVIRKIGHGGFGQIYESKDIYKGNLVAIKSEPAENKRQLSRMEVDVLKAVKGKDHFCRFIGCGRTHIFNYVVMELQGPNLSELKHGQPSNCFSLSTTLRIGHQILQAIEYLHGAGFVHRDIKPSNFAMGLLPENKHKVYMLDFGLARDYLTKDKQLRPPRNACGFRGTVRYASINAHKNRELGRVDDLWSLFYMLAEFIEGSLPWRSLKDRNRVGAMKECFDHHHLIHRMPDDYEFFLEELLTLTYFDKPHYDDLHAMFEKCKQTRGVRDSDPYDWEIEQDKVCLEIFAAGTITVSSRSDNSRLTIEIEDLEPHVTDSAKKEQKSETKENIPASADINRLQNELNDGSPLRYDNDCSNCQLSAENCSNEDIKLRHVNNCVSKVPCAKQNGSHVVETKTDKYENMQAKLSVPKVSRKSSQVAKSKSQPKVFSSQFAVADDDISSVQQVTKGGGLALTLVSKWQYSFDYTEAADGDFNNDYIENSRQNEFINDNQTKFSSFFTQRDENKVCLASKGKWMMSKKENRTVEKCVKRRRPVRRSVSHPAKIPPNVTVRNILNDYSNGSGFLRIGDLDNSGQAPQGLPRCWSCPTISLFIRSHLKPPLKQQASFDENVYEVDVMRNVAAKQGVKEEVVSSSDERRTSLPHISITDVQSENIKTSCISSENKTVPDVLWSEPLNQVNNICHKEESKTSSKDNDMGCINHLQRSASLCQKGILKNACDKYKTNHKTGGSRLQRSRSGPSDMWQKGKVTNVSFIEKKSDPFVSASKQQVQSSTVVPQANNSIYMNASEGNSSTAFLTEVRDVTESTVNGKIISKNSCLSTSFQNYFSLDLGENNNMASKNMNNHCEHLDGSPKENSDLFGKVCNSENINDLEHAPQQLGVSLKNITSLKQESLIHPTEHFTRESCSLSDATEKMINVSKTLECQKEASEIPIQVPKSENHETSPIPQIILSTDVAPCEKDNTQPYSVKEQEIENKICIENEHSALLIKQISAQKGSIDESVFQNVTEQENNSVSQSSSENYSQNKDRKPVTRRCRENPDCKYVKDESELKLNFPRRRQRPVSVACSSHLPNPYISKHLSDFPSLTNGDKVDSINRFYQKDSDMTELQNELSLQRVSSLPSVPLLNKQLPLYFQDQAYSPNVCQKLPTPPPGEPPLKYCLPSRRMRYKVSQTMKNQEIILY